ncbi:MAG: glycoside hydrolase [Thaumarchaeota archaeon]|nr:glycoside hydrolase [Nitrososphaerota archaeon]
MKSTDISIRRVVKGQRAVVASGWGMGYFPVVIRLKNGEVVAVVRGGAEHMGSGGRLDMVRSKDMGATWSKPATAFDTPTDDRNPALGQAGDGTLILGFIIVSGYAKGYVPHKGTPDYKFYDYLMDVWIPAQSKSESYYILSKDNGRTWTERTPLDVPGYSVSPFGRIIGLDDGTLLMNVYGSKVGYSALPSYAFALRSTDNGRTWGEPSLIAKDMNETSFLNLGRGRVIAVLRSDEPEEATYLCASADSGRTWDEPRRITGALEHPADLAKLGDGRLLLVYGHRRFPYGVRGLISDDDGTTWNKDREIIFSDDAENQDCGYPSVLRLPNGQVLLLYYQLSSYLYPKLPAHCNAIRVNEKVL